MKVWVSITFPTIYFAVMNLLLQPGTCVAVVSVEEQASLDAAKLFKDLSRRSATRFWPDFSCVPGWYDVKNRDTSHPLALNRSAGVVYLHNLYKICELQFSPDGKYRCVKQCMLEQLQLLELNSNPDLEQVVPQPTDIETFTLGLGQVLTDPGGDFSLKWMVNNMWPGLKSSKIWPKLVNARCYDEVWDELYAEVDSYILKESTNSCITLRNEIDLKTEYLSNNYSVYTANLDLSCYHEFVYKGVDSGEGDMVRFMELYSDCQNLLKKNGIKRECHYMCMFTKMGLIQLSRNKEDKSFGGFVKKERMIEILLRYFTGPNNVQLVTKFATWMIEQCTEKFKYLQTKSGLSCSEMSIIQDCIERVISCNYTGNFLAEAIVTRGRSLGPNRAEYSGYPKMSCRQGYQNTFDRRRGSGLLMKYSAACESLVKNGYYDCDKQCMLNQIGVISEGVTRRIDGHHRTTFLLADEQDMTVEFNKILPGFGGFDTGYEIAKAIHQNCTSTFEKIGNAQSCNSTVWINVFECVTNLLECNVLTLSGVSNNGE